MPNSFTRPHDNHAWDDVEEDDDNPGAARPIADPATGTVRLVRDKCATCIFHRGNRMHLTPGRVGRMTVEACQTGGHIVCHKTLTGGNTPELPGAICRGFRDTPIAQRLSLALRLIASGVAIPLYLDTETGELHTTDGAPARRTPTPKGPPR